MKKFSIISTLLLCVVSAFGQLKPSPWTTTSDPIVARAGLQIATNYNVLGGQANFDNGGITSDGFGDLLLNQLNATMIFGSFFGNGSGITGISGSQVVGPVQSAIIASRATNAIFASNPNGLTPQLVSSLIQPGGNVVLGDSLDVWFVTNFPGFFGNGILTNGAVVCGGTTNAQVNGVGWFTNGYTLLPGEAQAFMNQSWLMLETNYIAQKTGWNVPLDNALCVSGAGYMNYGDADIAGSEFEGYQAFANGNTYNANGTNSVFFVGGMTNRLVFWGTNNWGTTNDYYVVQGGVTYANPNRGNDWQTNIFISGTYGGNVAASIVGAPNKLISVRNYPAKFAGSWGAGSTSRVYYPPFYQNTFANDPLIYLTNISPSVTGIRKSLFLPGSQNDRTFTYVHRGTNGAPTFVTNIFNFVLQNQLVKLTQIGRNLGFQYIHGATIPLSPSSISLPDLINLNSAYSSNSVRTNFDSFYDWQASNSVYQGNNAYYADTTHPNALLAGIEATNRAQFYEVTKSAVNPSVNCIGYRVGYFSTPSFSWGTNILTNVPGCIIQGLAANSKYQIQISGYATASGNGIGWAVSNSVAVTNANIVDSYNINNGNGSHDTQVTFGTTVIGFSGTPSANYMYGKLNNGGATSLQVMLNGTFTTGNALTDVAFQLCTGGATPGSTITVIPSGMTMTITPLR